MLPESQPPPSTTPPEATPTGRPAAPGTLLLLGINFAVFGLEWALSNGNFSQDVLLAMGANDPVRVWAGEWWRLITCAFLHGGLLHIAVNMQALWVLGHFLEEELGAFRVWMLYLGSALLGSAASIALGSGAVSVGASGAVFGFVGALLSLTFLAPPQHRKEMRRMRGQLVWTVILNLALGMWLNSSGGAFRIDNMAHLGGLLGGLLLGAGIFASLLKGPTAPITVAAYALFALTTSAALGVALHPRQTIRQLAVKAVQAREAGDVATMSASLDQAMRLDPTNPEVLLTRVLLCRASGKDACATQTLDVLLALEPMPPNSNYPQVDETELTRALAVLGMQAAVEHDFHTAVVTFNRVAALQPDDKEALNNLAWFILRSPHTTDAEKKLALDTADRARRIANHGLRATLLGPDVNVTHTYAEALRQNGRLDEALDILRGFAAMNRPQRWLLSDGKFTDAVIESEMERMRAGRPPVDF